MSFDMYVYIVDAAHLQRPIIIRCDWFRCMQLPVKNLEINIIKKNLVHDGH